MPFLLIGAALILIVGGVLAARKYMHNQAHQDRQKALLSAAQTTVKVAKKNLAKLETGNIQWRRVGHGQDLMGIARLTPKEGTEKAEDFTVLKEEHPAVVSRIKHHDRKVRALTDAASKLAATIQGKVKEQYETDRSPDDGGAVVRNLPQDGWIHILQGLINCGEFNGSLKGNLAEYWSKREEQYEKILDGYGGPHYRKFRELKEDIKQMERDLSDKLSRIIRQAEHQA